MGTLPSQTQILSASGEARWILRESLAVREHGRTGVGEPEEVVRLAQTFGLTSRLVSRVGATALVAVLGRISTYRMVAAQAASEDSAEKLASFLPRLAEIVEGIGARVVFLKYAALFLHKVTGPASRSATDLDVLVQREHLVGLDGALQEAGFQASSAGVLASEHQLPVLSNPSLGVRIELHRHIPGVNLGRGRRFADLAGLRDAGLLQRVEELPGACFVPRRDVLLAHLLVHLLAQHGLSPQKYPVFRALGDLIDMGLGGPEGPELASQAHRWISRWVSRADLDATRELCAALAEGDESVFDSDPAARPATALLAHFLAGTLDAEYAQSLRSRAVLGGLSELPAPLRPVRAVLSALLLNDAQVDAIYGPSRSRWGYWGRRLQRPFHLLWLSARPVMRRLGLGRPPNPAAPSR